MKKRWLIERQDITTVQQLQDDLGVSVITAKILAARGFTTAEAAQKLLQVDDTMIHDPFLLHDMDKAVARIEEALEDGQKIRIYGDYDCDGVTSTSVMLHVLLDLGADVDFVIPNRFTHGYGPNEALFREAAEDGVQLIITVDNGISGVEPIRVAKELGVDVIVTDHHEPGEELPPADIIIHPRVPEGQYPFPELAGVGVALKLAHALYGEFPVHLLPLAALGTVADLVPLVDENRFIVKQGLLAMQNAEEPWIQALCEVSGVEQSTITEETLGFYFGPRVNAVGRLGDAMPGVHLMMSVSLEEAQVLAKQLNDCNTERKALVDSITAEAMAIIEAQGYSKDRVLIIDGEGWNAGVVGIVASRIVEKYYRPTIVLCRDEESGMAKGSARSIEGFHLYNELAKNRAILAAFGGHPMAAGMTVATENIAALRKNLNEQAQSLSDEQLIPLQKIDIALTIADITVTTIEETATLGPFGTDFPKPVYALEKVEIKEMRKIGAGEKHIKMVLEDNGDTLDAIGFNIADWYDEMTFGTEISFIGDVQVNEWQGNKKPQFLLRDKRVTDWQLFDIRGIKQTSRWLQKVPVDEVQFIAFNQATCDYFYTLLPAPITLVTDDTELTQGDIVILDLPTNEAVLESVLQQTAPQRIYAHFYTHQAIHSLPSREQFAWFYKFLYKRPNFDLKSHLNQLASHTGWSLETLKLMTKVFFELGFVKIDKGLTTIATDAPKTPLQQAPSYQQQERKLALEQQLVYAPQAALKQWFAERLHVDVS